MIDLAMALEIVQGAVPARTSGGARAAGGAGAVSFSTENVQLSDALGRVLAREMTTPIDSPPFDKSAMDGFAVGAQDASARFRVLETVAAGSLPSRAVQAGECARIMTGAMLPPGTGRVIRKELVAEENGSIRVLQPETGANVVPRGENLRCGDVALRPRVLRPQDIAILAASGIADVPVVVPPAAGIIATGSEVRTPGQALRGGQIYDSNSPMLAAQLASLRVPARFLGIVPDSPGPLRAAIAGALDDCSLVLLSGGVSEGDFDFVPRCLEDLGAEILFHRVAIKPGKPTLFARRGDRFVFGMPGNPVSAFVIFEVFVRPFLCWLMGVDGEPVKARGKLAAAVRRKAVERAELIPVRLEAGEVKPVPYHGSAHLNALGDAHGIILIPKGVGLVGEGEEVDVRLF